MSQRLIYRRLFWLFLVICLGQAGCTSAPPPAREIGPLMVTVSYPLQREVTEYAEFPGRTAAVDSVQVRARVSGYLLKVNFKEGSEVKQGDVLYEIDAQVYQAALKQAQAQVGTSGC